MNGILNVQINITQDKPEINRKKVEHFIKKYSDKTLDLVVLPENFSLYDTDGLLQETLEFFVSIAKKFNTNIVAGSIVEKDGEKFYNTSYVFDRTGNLAGKYRKIHLLDFIGEKESENLSSGEDFVVVELDFAKIGLAIGYDLRFPMMYKNLSNSGADIIVQPSMWTVPNEIYEDEESLRYAQGMWVALNRTRAYDNALFLIVSNQTKQISDAFCGIGNSMIISPTSQVIANAEDRECAIYADIDVQEAKYMKQLFPVDKID